MNASNATKDSLVFVTEALRTLLANEHFATLLRAEGIDSLPRNLPIGSRLASRRKNARQAQEIGGHSRLRTDDSTHPIGHDPTASPYCAGTKRTAKYAQIAASGREVGLVEPPVAAKDRNNPRKDLNAHAIKIKRKLLDGVCAEAAELLKDKHVPINAFAEFKKMAPMRQIEAAELMVAMNKYTTSYAESLFAATPRDQLADSTRKKS